MLERPFANIKLDRLSENLPELGIQTVRGFAELESTSTWAIRNSGSFTDDQLPLLIVCDSQTAGRGRLGRSWHADSGTLTFSILCDPARVAIPRENISSLALMAGLSVAEAIDASIPPHTARIKWPNDVLVAGRKVAGILIENVPWISATPAVDRDLRTGTIATTGDEEESADVAIENKTSDPPVPAPSGSASSQPKHRSRIVIGIGINVSTDFSTAPEEVGKRAGSLEQLSGRLLPPGHLLTELLQRFSENCIELASEGLEPILRAVRTRCSLTGQRVRLMHAGQTFAGNCLGLSGTGELLVELSGRVVAFQSGEVVRAEEN